jgi:hypothetical protein
MATNSSRNFNNYSGLSDFKQNQPGITPNAQQRLGDPAATQALRDTNPSALGLSERGARPSGRSFYDPARQAERWVRGTGSQGQYQASVAAREENEAADPIEAARRRAFPANQAGVNNYLQGAPIAIPTQIPQSVGDPIFQPIAPQPPAPPPVPNVFAGNRPPASAISRYSIGNAMNGGAISGNNPSQVRIPVRYY